MPPLFHLLLIFTLLFSVLGRISAVRINITNGEIEGKELTATYSIYGNQTSVVFFGIPHIEPPVGDLRFRRPQKYTRKWDGILETKEFKPACMSDPKATYGNPKGGPVSEDCLYINVYTNHYCLENKNCSVLIAVHGGQFIRGTPAMYMSDVITNNFLAEDRNIIVVTVPYRLGIFGLPNLPGDLEGIADRNLILYDIIEGLKWVKREISNFGGDSNRTTLFGHSGGATISATLGLVQECDDLYQQVVLMSAPWLVHSNNSNSKIFRKIARHAECLNSSQNEIFECMRRVDAEKLIQLQTQVFHDEEEYFSDFAIDGKLLLDDPRRLLETGAFKKRPIMTGTVPFEERLTQYFMKDNGEFNQKEILKMCELFGFAGAFENPYGFVEKCVEFYMQNDTYEHLLDDYMFHLPAANLARQSSSEEPAYLYSYKYTGVGAAYSDYDPGKQTPEHSEDFVYIFGTHRNRLNFTEKDMKIERVFSKMIADFVNFGKPCGPIWTPLNPDIMDYFDIDFAENSAGEIEMPGMNYEFYKKQLEFWNKVAKEAGGEFSYSQDSSKSFDVFPALEFAQFKNIVYKTKFFVYDKSEEVARKTSAEIEGFIEKKKKQFDELPNSEVGLSVVSLISLVLFQRFL